MQLRWRYVPVCVVPFLALHCGHSNKPNSETAVLAEQWAALTSNSAEATMALRSDWGTGYCADVSIVNRGSTPISGWTLVLDLRQSAINQIWNGTVTGSTVSPVSFNKAIAPGASVGFGFCANATGTPYLPAIASMQVTGGDPGGGTGGASNGGSGGASKAGGAGTPGSGGSGQGGASNGGTGQGGTSAGKGGSSNTAGTSSGKGGAPGAGGTPGAGGATGNVTGATIRFDSDWGSGYCATVSLQGSGAWSVVLNLNGSQINNLWNGTFTTSGSTATVQGNQPSFGFCAISAQASFRASIASVNGNTNTNGGKGGATGAGGSGTGGTGKGGASNGSGGSGSGGKGSGGASSGGSSNNGSANCNGYATRFWDCCKPHCGWSGNVPSGVNPMNSCSANDQTLSGYGQSSSCDGGSAFTCQSLIPYAVNSQLSYGYAATSHGDVCGRCYELQFQGYGHSGNDPGSNALAGKSMIVQAINVGFDVSGGQFDLLIPGGGVGAFNACSTQWGVSNSELGVQYGGFLAACKQELGYNASSSQYKSCVANRCQKVFGSRGLSELQAGCQWFVDWFQAADNPALKYREVACPSALTSGSGMNRTSRNDISNSCSN
jgi:hypothetical protein